VTRREALAYALGRHPECSYAEAEYGLNIVLQPTWQVNLWRNKECRDAGDPVRAIEDNLHRDGPLFPGPGDDV